jgi:hypothetical protein
LLTDDFFVLPITSVYDNYLKFNIIKEWFLKREIVELDGDVASLLLLLLMMMMIALLYQSHWYILVQVLKLFCRACMEKGLRTILTDVFLKNDRDLRLSLLQVVYEIHYNLNYEN